MYLEIGWKLMPPVALSSFSALDAADIAGTGTVNYWLDIDFAASLAFDTASAYYGLSLIVLSGLSARKDKFARLLTKPLPPMPADACTASD